MKSTISLLIAAIMLLSHSSYAEIENQKAESVKINGNCQLCKEKIEKAGNAKNSAQVFWDQQQKSASLTYNSKKTTKDEILKRIAVAVFDNELFYAPDDVYSNLPECCRYARTKKDMATDSHYAMNHHESTKTEGTQINPLRVVTSSYLALKDALVQSNGELASGKASELVMALTTVKTESLKGETHMSWMKVKDALIEDAAHINETKDLSHQRDHFNSLSQNLYKLLKGSSSGTTLYYQHCPMFNSGKGGDWISQESSIKNPFYGTKMLSCGSTVETIK